VQLHLGEVYFYVVKAEYFDIDSPLAIRMLKPGEAIPEGVKIPSKTMGEQWIVCQSIGWLGDMDGALPSVKTMSFAPWRPSPLGFASPTANT